VYNKYIGNTGRFIRVEDHPRANTHNAGRPAVTPPPSHNPMSEHPIPEHPMPQQHEPVKQVASSHRTEGIKNKPLFSGLGGGLNNLIGGLGSGLGGIFGGHGGGHVGGPGGLTDGLKGMFDHLPFGLDIGDILLFLLLFFFFIESGDEEFIFILAIIAYGMFKDR
jgi:hypothetical protein